MMYWGTHPFPLKHIGEVHPIDAPSLMLKPKSWVGTVFSIEGTLRRREAL